MENKKQCPYCGEKIAAEAQKCRFCGEWLVQEPSTDSTPHFPSGHQEPQPPISASDDNANGWFHGKVRAAVIIASVAVCLYSLYNIVNPHKGTSDNETENIADSLALEDEALMLPCVAESPPYTYLYDHEGHTINVYKDDVFVKALDLNDIGVAWLDSDLGTTEYNGHVYFIGSNGAQGEYWIMATVVFYINTADNTLHSFVEDCGTAKFVGHKVRINRPLVTNETSDGRREYTDFYETIDLK